MISFEPPMTQEQHLPRPPSAAIFVKSKEEALADVRSWLQSEFQEKKGFFVPKREVFGAYADFCAENNYESTTPASFGKFLKRVFPSVETRRLIRNNEQAMYYFNLKRVDASDTPSRWGRAAATSLSSSPPPPVNPSPRPTLLLPKTASSPPTHRRRSSSETSAPAHAERAREQHAAVPRLSRSSSPSDKFYAIESSMPMPPAYAAVPPPDLGVAMMLQHQLHQAPIPIDVHHLQRIQQLQHLVNLQQYQQQQLAEMRTIYERTFREPVPSSSSTMPTPMGSMHPLHPYAFDLADRQLPAPSPMRPSSTTSASPVYGFASPMHEADVERSRSSRSPSPSPPQLRAYTSRITSPELEEERNPSTRRRGSKRRAESTDVKVEELVEVKSARLNAPESEEHGAVTAADHNGRQSPREEMKEKSRLSFILN